MTRIGNLYFESGPIIDRDPGDETQGYRALYRLADTYFVRTFRAESMEHAWEQAEDALGEGESLAAVHRYVG